MSAHYYPNLSSVTPIRIGGAHEVNATNDCLAATSEVRHFVDYNYLRSIESAYIGGLVQNMIEPTPPCNKLTGTFTPGGDEVIGMLPFRLHIALYLEDGFYTLRDGDINERNLNVKSWTMVKLANVLVVKSLPVPLHISFRGLGKDFSPKPSFGRHMRAGLFPPTFRSHAYWNKGQDVISVSELTISSIEDFNARSQFLLDGRTGKPNQTSFKVCLNCGSFEAREHCSRCKVAFYCSRDCQKAHWKIVHKQVCTPAANELS